MILDHLDSLRLRFIERCRGELRSLREIRDAPLTALEGTPGDTLMRTVHGLAGAGATFGFPEVSRRAGDLETLLLEKNSPDVDRRRALDHLIATLEALTGPAAQAGASTNP